MTKPVAYPVKFQREAARVLAFVTAHPEKHNQSGWVGDYDAVMVRKSICGTTLCAAGTAVYLREGVQGLVDTIKCTTGKTWSERGAEILGLTDLEADRLFYDMDNESAKRSLALLSLGDLAGFRTSRGLSAQRGSECREYFL